MRQAQSTSGQLTSTQRSTRSRRSATQRLSTTRSKSCPRSDNTQIARLHFVFQGGSQFFSLLACMYFSQTFRHFHKHIWEGLASRTSKRRRSRAPLATIPKKQREVKSKTSGDARSTRSLAGYAGTTPCTARAFATSLLLDGTARACTGAGGAAATFARFAAGAPWPRGSAVPRADWRGFARRACRPLLAFLRARPVVSSGFRGLYRPF